jgi:hypothetical protein
LSETDRNHLRALQDAIMPQSANVRSLEAIRRFRAALIKFQEEGAATLASLRQELDRTVEWIDHDRPRFWQLQVRKCSDNVDTARSQLSRARMRTIGGHHPSCVEEQIALRRAKQALEVARQKGENVRRWKIKLHQDIEEYRGRIGLFEQCLYRDVPRMLALLEGMLGALEGYVTTPGAVRETGQSQEFGAGGPASAPDGSEATTPLSRAEED